MLDMVTDQVLELKMLLLMLLEVIQHQLLIQNYMMAHHGLKLMKEITLDEILEVLGLKHQD